MTIKSFLPLTAIAALSVAGGALASDGGRPISVQMSGAAERPGPGDPTAPAPPISASMPARARSATH